MWYEALLGSLALNMIPLGKVFVRGRKELNGVEEKLVCSCQENLSEKVNGV